MKRLRRWLKYIEWRRGYWDACIDYGKESLTARWFRLRVWRYSSNGKQYSQAIDYANHLIGRNGLKDIHE